MADILDRKEIPCPEWEQFRDEKFCIHALNVTRPVCQKCHAADKASAFIPEPAETWAARCSEEARNQRKEKLFWYNKSEALAQELLVAESNWKYRAGLWKRLAKKLWRMTRWLAGHGMFDTKSEEYIRGRIKAAEKAINEEK